MTRLFAMLMPLILLACAGTAARNETLLPAIRNAWPGVQADATAGVHAAVTTAEITAEAAVAAHKSFADAGVALEVGDVVAIASVPWVSITGFAERGITARVMSREVGPGVASSLRERLAQFRAALSKFTGVTP